MSEGWNVVLRGSGLFGQQSRRSSERPTTGFVGQVAAKVGQMCKYIEIRKRNPPSIVMSAARASSAQGGTTAKA